MPEPDLQDLDRRVLQTLDDGFGRQTRTINVMGGSLERIENVPDASSIPLMSTLMVDPSKKSWTEYKHCLTFRMYKWSAPTMPDCIWIRVREGHLISLGTLVHRLLTLTAGKYFIKRNGTIFFDDSVDFEIFRGMLEG